MHEYFKEHRKSLWELSIIVSAIIAFVLLQHYTQVAYGYNFFSSSIKAFGNATGT